MPPPGSFIDITPTPFSRTVTQAEFNGGTFGGVANEVWFRFVTAVQIALGLYTNNGGTFSPTTSLFESDGTTLVRTVNNSVAWYQILSSGTYYLRIRRNGGGASNFDFTTQSDIFPVNVKVYNAGDFIINDDTEGYPAALINGSTGEVRSFITGIPASEVGAILPDGTQLWHDRFGTAGPIDTFAVFDSTLTYVASTAAFGHLQFPRATAGATHFYVVDGVSFEVFRVDATGARTLLGTLSTRPQAIAVDAAETTLFWVVRTGNAHIHAWDLATGSDLADFGVITGYDTVNDILARSPNFVGFPGDMCVLADGSVVTWYTDTSAGLDKVVVFDSGGTQVQTWAQSANLVVDHLASVSGSSTSIFIWLLDWTDGFQHGTLGVLNVTTGVISPSYTKELFSAGINQVSGSSEMFGPSESCTVLMFGLSGGESALVSGVIGPILWWRFAYREP